MRIVLISDDSDFFDYISPKLILRKSDELFRFSFKNIPEEFQSFLASLLIINSENAENKTLELLSKIKEIPSIVFTFNENENFKLNAYKSGMCEYVTIMTPDDELQAKMIPLLTTATLIEKNKQYRDMLVKNNLISQENDVYTDYNNIIDNELEKINITSTPAVLAAISTNDKTKKQIFEKIILGNIRKTDILMNFAPNKYFLILYNTDLNSSQKIIDKIKIAMPEKVFSGLSNIIGKNRQQIVNEVLNKLHQEINYDKDYSRTNKNPLKELGATEENFKAFKKEFQKKLEQIITPVFYHFHQKYNNPNEGLNIELLSGEDFRTIRLRNRIATGNFKITSPGYSKINIDISYQLSKGHAPNPKRITIAPDELEGGLLTDLLEQFIIEFAKEASGDNN